MAGAGNVVSGSLLTTDYELKTGTVEERIGRKKVKDQREDEEESKEKVAEHRKRSRRREKTEEAGAENKKPTRKRRTRNPTG